MSLGSKSAKGFVFIIPACTAFSHSSFNSRIEEIQRVSSPSSVLQIGSGVPQKRERDKFQSFKFSSHFPKRPVPVDSGCQLIVLFNSTILSFLSVTRTNQESNG